ncbi:MAG: hypothetical protein R8L53_02600 [Mariprofundales bacterium]
MKVSYWHSLPYKLFIIILLSFTILASCTTNKHLLTQQEFNKHNNNIGNYPAFSGRLIVITPKQRWQVELDWHASNADKGWLRLVHAASNTIIECRWQDDKIWLRDQQQPTARLISMSELSAYGLVLHPAIIAKFLLGQSNPNITADKYKTNTWNIRTNDSDKRNIRLQWYQGQRKLIISDIKQGKQAHILIEHIID